MPTIREFAWSALPSQTIISSPVQIACWLQRQAIGAGAKDAPSNHREGISLPLQGGSVARFPDHSRADAQRLAALRTSPSWPPTRSLAAPIGGEAFLPFKPREAGAWTRRRLVSAAEDPVRRGNGSSLVVPWSLLGRVRARGSLLEPVLTGDLVDG